MRLKLSRRLTVPISQLVLVAIIYWPTLQLEFFSDSWVYLWRIQTDIWALLTKPTGYHYQPAACAWVAMLHGFFGQNPTAFQAVLMAQLALFSYLTYELGRRLLSNETAAFLGSLLVISSAAFYETMYWPLAGNMHLMAAQLYLLALILAVEIARGRLMRTGPWLLGLTVLTAVFAHPAMITSVPICALTLFLARSRVVVERTSRNGHCRKKALVALAAVMLPFMLSRFAFAATFDYGPKPALERMNAYALVSRGLIAVFSLRGSDDVVHRAMMLGTETPPLTSRFWYFVAGWLAAASVAGLSALRMRTPGPRLLVVALALHITVLAIAGGMSSRQSHLPAAFAGLLSAWALVAVAQRLKRSVTSTAAAWSCSQLPVVGIMVLVAAANADHRHAAEVHVDAATLTRTLVNKISDVASTNREVINLTLINMPAYTVGHGFGAATFANGIGELVRLTSQRVADLRLYQTSLPHAPIHFANGSTLVAVESLKTELTEPSRVAILFEAPSRLRVVTARDLERLAVQ